MRAATSLLAVVLFAALTAAQSQPGKTLEIYVVDVEGGNATLFVAPSGESLLMDTGNGGAAATRDADRIMAAVKDAGLSQIDHLITTHWHGDHFGAMAELAARIPIRHYIDHGPNVQPQPASNDSCRRRIRRSTRRRSTRSRSRAIAIPIAGLDWRIVTSAGEAIKTPLPGAGRPNPLCASFQAAGCRPDRERAVGRQRRHVRQVPARAPRRPDLEQGIRSDVPEQSDRHRGCVLRVASRPAGLERRSARARARSRASRS